MKQLPLFFLSFLLTSGIVSGQQFSLVNTNLEALSNSSAAWGDYDNDGDLDIVLTGENQNMVPQTKIYRNAEGVFEETVTVLPGLTTGSVAWGDYDLDGDLDLLITGSTDGMNAISLIVRNDNGQFTESGITLPGVMNGKAVWDDYDNDGDPDILIAGQSTGLIFTAMILQNDGNGMFADAGISLPGVQNASVAWVDYNNDGIQDALISGDSGGGMISRLFMQDNGTFTEVNPGGFLGLSNGDVAWGDMDNDGDMDLVLTGVDLYLDGFILLYSNDGNDQFTSSYTLNNPMSNTAVDLGDYNNDGWLDIIVTGTIVGCGGTAATLLYRNETFMNFFEVSTLIPGYKQGDVTWGDFNNDGYADILFTGADGYDVPKTQLYQNNGGNGIFSVNTPPGIPQGLMASTSGNDVTISWERSLDAQTPSPGMSYNLYIGTTPLSPDIFAPNANQLSGIRHLASIGNTCQDTSWTVAGLDDGTYYCSVQAIDNGYLGSGFSPEQSFAINAVGLSGYDDRGAISLYPNPAQTYIDLQIFDPGYAISDHGSRIPDPGVPIDILDAMGKLVKSLPSSGSFARMDVSKLVPGLYVVRIRRGDQVFLQRFIKE